MARCFAIAQNIKATQARIRKRSFLAVELLQKLSEKNAERARYRALAESLISRTPELQQCEPVDVGGEDQSASNASEISEIRRLIEFELDTQEVLRTQVDQNRSANDANLKKQRFLLETEKNRTIDLLVQLECSSRELKAAQEQYAATERQVADLKQEYAKLTEDEEAAAKSIQVCREDHIRMEKEINDLKMCQKQLDNEANALQVRCEELERKLAVIQEENTNLETTIRNIERECLKKSKETETFKVELGTLQTQLAKDTDIKRELSQRLSESKTACNELEKELRESTQLRDTCGIQIKSLERVNARASKYCEGLRIERAKLTQERKMDPNLCHISDWLKVKKTSERNRSTNLKPLTSQERDRLTQECTEMESEIHRITSELESMRSSGLVDEFGNRKPALIEDINLQDTVKELGINDALIAAQKLEDGDACMEMMVGIIATILEKIEETECMNKNV